MITKITQPIICNGTLIGTLVEYRVLGILYYKKILYMPDQYGLTGYNYITRI
jgi:hypothetical protein